MKIAHIVPMIYTPGELNYSQFIRGGIGADYHQGPIFYQFPNGDVIVHWHAYDYKETSDNAVRLYSVSRDHGLTWSDPQVFMADYSVGQVSDLLMLPLQKSDNVLMIFKSTNYIKVEEGKYTRGRTHLFIRRSFDGGRTFEYGDELPYRLMTGGWALPEIGFYGTISELIQLQNGCIVAVFYFRDPARDGEHYTAACLLSEDGGYTWKRSGEITVDTPRGVMEPQMVETEPNRLFCLFRTKGGFVYQTVSTGGGDTWSKPIPSSLASPESMVRMIKLQSGNLLAVWNNVSSVTQHPRHPLVAAVSRDGGGTWSKPHLIADETGSNQLSNHGLIQLDDGRILLGVSHYRAVYPNSSDLDMVIFDEKWLEDV